MAVAAREGNDPQIHLLWEWGASDLNRALAEAVKVCNTATARLLRELGATDVDRAIRAILNECAELVKEELGIVTDGVVPDTIIEETIDSLTYIWPYFERTIELLKDWGVTEVQFNEIMIQAAFDGQTVLMELCLKWGGSDLNNALVAAARGGQTVNMHLLLKRGASDVDGALKTAAAAGQTKSLQLLLDWGPSEFNAALLLAANSGQMESAHLLWVRAPRGAIDLDEAFAEVAFSGQIGMARKLRDWGAKDFDKALLYAARSKKDRTEMTCELLRWKAAAKSRKSCTVL